MPLNPVFPEIAAILTIAGLLGMAALKLKQPLIVAFILVGLLMGPAGLNWVQAHDQVDIFAKLGIAILLFVVGLKLDLTLIRSVGKATLYAGFGQIALTFILGYFITFAFGFTSTTAFYIALAMTFSSTIIIVKLLSDKREIEALHGRLALGILIFQDLVIILTLIGMTAFSAQTFDSALPTTMLQVALKGIGLLLIVALIARLILPKLMRWLSYSNELLILMALAWAIGLSAITAHLGFSKEVGAFIAGVALAATPFRTIIATRLTILRDFLLLFFFVSLGVNIDISNIKDMLGIAIILSIFVLICKPIIVLTILRLMGYRKRTSILASLTLGQISEFSFILAALGITMGHINEQAATLITLIGLITIGASSYIICYSHAIYDKIGHKLTWFERPIKHPEDSINEQQTEEEKKSFDIIIFGLGRYGGNIAQQLKQKGYKVLGIDFNPEMVKQWHKQGLKTQYGDIEDLDFLHTLSLKQIKWIVSTIDHHSLSTALVHELKQLKYKGKIAITAHNTAETEQLKTLAADKILSPFHDAAAEAADSLMENNNQKHT